MTRAAIIAVALAPLCAFTFVAAFLGLEAVGINPMSHVEATIAEAAASGSAARALELLRAGQDPNRPALIPAGVLDSNAYQMTAIEASIAGRRAEMIEPLLEHGARVDDPARALCLAEAVDVPEAVRTLHLTTRPFRHDPSVDTSDAVRACLGRVATE
jgi:hypothetical protein